MRKRKRRASEIGFFVKNQGEPLFYLDQNLSKFLKKEH